MTSPLQITNLPAIKAFTAPYTVNPYTKKPHRDQAPYEGAANARSMQKHVLAQIPDTLIERQTGESFPPSTEGGSALVLLFTDRDSSSPLYKSLANSFAGRLTFSEVRHGVVWRVACGAACSVSGAMSEMKMKLFRIATLISPGRPRFVVTASGGGCQVL